MAQNLDTKNLNKQLNIIGVESIGFLTKLLTEEGKRATGDLIQSLDYQVIKEVDGLMLKILAAPYFKNVDEGRRPGAKPPPVKAIQSWVNQKNIVFTNMSSKQTAFIIARSIGVKGIKPLHAKDKLISNILSNKAEILKYAAGQDIQEMLNKIFYSTK
jgi:hypothetical protein